MKPFTLAFLIVFALSACGKKEAESAAAAEPGGTQSVPRSVLDPAVVAEEPADALGEISEPENDFAVDEPLPPFDEGFDSTPELIARGDFEGVAPVAAVGQVQLYAIPDGSHLLRLENLRITGASGDLQLRLLAGSTTLKLGALKGTSGNQNYLADPSKAKTFSALEIYSGSATIARATLIK